MKSQKFKKLRKALGLTQTALGEEIGVSSTTIARWERGETSIPKAVAKLLPLMAKAIDSASVVATSSAVSRDSHHLAILEALNGHLDPDVFEACAVDLLATNWPGLTPVRGGSDDGFDGAVGSSDKPPVPLVTTTSADAKGNLRKNLRRALERGWRPKSAIFATARRITPKTRKALHGIADDLGVHLSQIYDQEWFGNALYRQPEWCKRLLGVTGRPSALSVIPLTSRPLLGERVLGREEQLEALRSIKSDCLVIGGPGSGKTFLLRALALEGSALFLTDTNREEIANAIRKQVPMAIIADDVHVDPEILVMLRQLRTEIHADFKIIAVSWPADSERVKSKIDPLDIKTIELPLIDRDTMVKIVKSSGLIGPNPVIATIVGQARGLPGLAVTLASLCLAGNVRDVLLGDSIVEQLSPSLDNLLREDSSRLLAVFGLGGAEGFPHEVVAAYLGKPLDEISSGLSRLSTAGVIRQATDGSISVWPEAFRWVLIKRVFFGGPGSLDYKPLFNQCRKIEEVVRTLLGARSRGATIPELEDFLEAQNSTELWSDYASLGLRESAFAISSHPELAIELADCALDFIPEQIIPLLLDKAVGDNRSLGNSLDHSLRKIRDWIKAWPMQFHDSHTKRQTLLSTTERWWSQAGKDNPDATSAAIRAFTIGFSSSWEGNEADPGQGRSITFTHGIVTEKETVELIRFWPSVSAVVMEAASKGFWTEILELIQDWLYTHPQLDISEALRARRNEFAELVLRDAAKASRKHPGVQQRLGELAKEMSLSLNLPVNPEFEVLYPREDLNQYREQKKEWSIAVKKLAAKWISLSPKDAATKIVWIEKEAQLVGRNWPRLSPSLCRDLSDSVANPKGWADAFLKTEVPSDLVEPFVRKVAETSNAGAIELLTRCLRSDNYRWISVSIAITLEDIPDDFLKKVAGYGGSFLQLIEVCCLRGEVSANAYRLLLTADDKQIALKAAIGEWNADRRKRSDLRLPDEWRGVILSSANADEINDHDGYWVGEILKSDPLLARDWLVKLGHSEKRFLRYTIKKAAEKAIAILSQSQRVEIIKSLKPENRLYELVTKLVGDDSLIYQRLLEIDSMSSFHLYPLQGPPNIAWAEKIILALEAGHSIEEVLNATRLRSWTCSGPESNMWISWKEAYEGLLDHENLCLVKVAERGVERMEEKIAACIKNERLESIYGD